MLSYVLTYTLEDASGQDVPIEEVERIFVDISAYQGGITTIFEPEQPLAPGAYTLRLSEASQDYITQRGDPATDVPLEQTFTVTDTLPPEGGAAEPTISWRAISYTGPQDPELFEQHANPCIPETNQEFMKLEFDVAAPGSDVPGYFTVAFGDEAFDSSLTSTLVSPTGVTLYAIKRDADFVQCVTVTFTDIYGRSAGPVRSCLPDQCVAKHKNDRDPVDWDDVIGCQDWSPGYTERNAPACACAQVPSTPPVAPAALALGLLGLVALRCRS